MQNAESSVILLCVIVHLVTLVIHSVNVQRSDKIILSSKEIHAILHHAEQMQIVENKTELEHALVFKIILEILTKDVDLNVF